MKILIVEDDATLGLLMLRATQSIKNIVPESQILIATTMLEAETLIHSESPPDVTFMDLTLPDSSFEKTVSRLPEFDEKTAVVVVTGAPLSSIHQTPPEIALVEKSTKLFSSDGLLRLIHAALSRRKDSSQRIEENFRKLDSLLQNGPAT